MEHFFVSLLARVHVYFILWAKGLFVNDVNEGRSDYYLNDNEDFGIEWIKVFKLIISISHDRNLMDFLT